MPNIPKTNISMINHQNTAVPAAGGRIVFRKDDTAGQIASAAGKMASAILEFKKKSDDTENMLSAMEAKNLYTQLDAELQSRMTENPGSFKDFGKWAEETDQKYRELSGKITDRMTPAFRKKFDLEMEDLRIRTKGNRIRIGKQAMVTDEINRFNALFKNCAENDPQEAVKLLDQHKGILISDQEYQRLKDVELPKLSQSAAVRRAVEANEDGIIEKLEAHDGKGNYTHFTAVTPEYRRSMIAYAKAKDSARRADELYRFAEELDSGIPISKQMIEDSFEGKTSAADLKQKQTMIQMFDRRESARERATTAANAKREEAQFQADWARIVNTDFPSETNARTKMYADIKQYIIGAYSQKGSKMETLLEKLDEYYKLPKTAAVTLKNTPLYQDGERILDGFKAQGRFAAGEEGKIWGVNESADKKTGTVSYVEDVLKADMTEFCKNNPQATVQQLNEYLNERITTYNKSTVAQIADMQLKNAVKRQGKGKNQKRTETLRDGTLGTYNGRKVIYKNGKWKYAE